MALKIVEEHSLHTLGILGLSILFPLVRWLLHAHLLQPLSYSLLQRAYRRAEQKASAEQLQQSKEKLCESLWKLLVYLCFSGLGIAAVWRQPWVLGTLQFWEGWPNQLFTLPMQLLYHLELSFYVSSVFMILFWEVRRKDFAAMFVHHLVTVAMLGASLQLRFLRIGCVAMLLHDATDVLMEAAKTCKYLQLDDAATGLFAMFMVAWAALRLCCYPLLVIRSTLLEMPGALGDAATPQLYYGFSSGMLLLLALHCYWFTLIVRIAYLQLSTGNTRDVREDDDL